MHEEVEDVQVEVDGRQDVLLGRHAVHDHGGIVDNEEREENGTRDSNAFVQHRSRNEKLKKTVVIKILLIN